ncbi:hypothetical protein AC579_5744 [Pseudocercospora musae]|uniref:RING-type domain-containing protein n=1 Tax=Pseudocercospora musae TaxID=113226 RepID=A0A139IRL4_9PEZI|nr:hypothetical protein AC579_5744 [Pseudocercospora musae]
MTPSAPRANSHLGQLLQATGVRPYDTRILSPTSDAYLPFQPISNLHGRPESSPLSDDYRTGIVEPEHRSFDRFIGTDGLDEADLPGLPGSFNTRSYTPSAPNSLIHALEHDEGPRGPPPSPTLSDDAMDAIGFQPTMSPYAPTGSGSPLREDNVIPHTATGDEALRLAREMAERIARDSLLAMILSPANRAAQAPGPGISIDALPKREITVADQGEDGQATCSICQENIDIGTAVTQLSCPHWFCTDCLEPWLHHRTCPTCRAPIMNSA